MYIKSFGINLDKSKRLWLIISFAFLVALVLIVSSFMLVFKNSHKSNIEKLTDLFEVTSYYAEYQIEITSNKNINNYKVKEWYKQEDNNYKFRFETSNKNSNFIYYGDSKNICVKSDEQISTLNLSDYNNKNNNILSVSSMIDFLELFNQTQKKEEYSKNNCFKIKEIENDSVVTYEIIFLQENKCNIDCKICSKFLDNNMNIKKIEILIDKEYLLPKQYNVHYEGEQMHVNIIYNKFSINEKFDEKLFAF